MKRKILLAITIILLHTQVFSQAKKPRIMIVPSDAWCITKGYYTSFDDQGTKKQIPDYKKAFQNDLDLKLVISKINGVMGEKGFPLISLEQTLKSLETNSAEDAILTSKTGGGVTESPIDKLRKTAKADIIMDLSYRVNESGPKKYVSFILAGLDAYSNKEIATATGNGAPSFSVDVPILLEEAVLNHMDNFSNSLQKHFDDLFENGREISIYVKKFDTWSGDLEKEYNGEELGTLIENWMKANTVKGRFSTVDATENQMHFDQVRIPLYDASGNAIDARAFARNLQKFLSAAPFSIVNKLMTKGLGQAVIVLGEK
ncbi:hypothetical protein EZ428_02205 [Pedobacter frigiditerrae]|uniref:Uncharacterized protein n=1 Tax=Pedobacter frigiditerrae TaxID=2530452 RepID=A0A4R0N1Q6_9SPHI|nr:DUF6175 family protein [Pedobacter frigiditerrae]TCC93605.1 hypothetical protein EZ428_02205 [Pedobacter frigiditerrae]